MKKGYNHEKPAGYFLIVVWRWIIYPLNILVLIFKKNKFEDLNLYYTDESAYDTVAPGLGTYLFLFLVLFYDY
jgi:hypothetical protein